MKAKTVIGGSLIFLGLDILTNGYISKAMIESIYELAKDKEFKEDIKELITAINKAIEESDKK